MTRTVGVVVPAYRPDLETLEAYVRAIQGELDPATVRIELDAPKSGVHDAVADLPATVNVAPERRGKGAAITAGFEALETDVLAFADADGSTPASSLEQVVATVEHAHTGLCVGSRRHPEATVRGHQSTTRRRLGDAFAWLARQVLDVSLWDYQCGAKATDAATWARVRSHLHEPGFGWDVELVAVAGALEVEVVEVPIEWTDRPRSTVSPTGTSVELLGALLGAHNRARRLRGDPLHERLAGTTPSLGDPRRPLVEGPEDSGDA